MWSQSNSIESKEMPCIMIKASDLFDILTAYDFSIYIHDIIEIQQEGFVKMICQNIKSFECKKLLKIHLEESLNKIISLSEESWLKKSFAGQISFPQAKVDTGPFSTQVINFLKSEQKAMDFDVTSKPISRQDQRNRQFPFISNHIDNKTYSVKGERISDEKVRLIKTIQYAVNYGISLREEYVLIEDCLILIN